MKYLLVLLLVAGCTNSIQREVDAKKLTTNGNTENDYELIRVGPYCCVGMDGYKAGGVWCERTEKECKL